MTSALDEHRQEPSRVERVSRRLRVQALPARLTDRSEYGRGNGAVATTAPAVSAESEPLSIVALLRLHWVITLVLAGYVVATFIVPTMTAVPVSDDWVYARSVEILVRDGDLRILDLSVVTLIFQVVWGALFALVFGMDFGSLRLSTVVLMLLSGWAVYGLCRELALSRGRAALGAAAYLFNPLSFVLGFSFMTDPQFTALLTIATFFYVLGLRPNPEGGQWLVLGSVMAAGAFLVRQQGALIPLAVVIFLLLARRLRIDRASVVLFARVVAIPAATTVLYYLWLRFVHGIPDQQESFVRSIEQAGWGGTWQLIERMSYVEAMYVGFYALPIAAGALLALPRLVWHRSLPGWGLFAAWSALLIAGLVVFSQPGSWPGQPRMPYVPQFFGNTGLGPNDIWAGRAPFVSGRVLDWFTGACFVASLLWLLSLSRNVRFRGARDGTHAGAGMILVIGLWQVFGILPPTYHFRTWVLSVDRYLLPLLPFAICLGLWAVRDLRFAWPVAWLAIAGFALLSVAGTRDFLVFQAATWDMARYANNVVGVPNVKLDAGSSWDGYHLYEYGEANAIPRQTQSGPWWTDLFAKATDSSYRVSSTPNVEGYVQVAWVEYSSWLHREPTYLHLLRRYDVPPPQR